VTPRITISGAGGTIFPVRVMIDVLAFPQLQECEFVLHDVDEVRLELTATRMRGIVERERLPTTIRTTLDRREAIEGTDYLVVTFQVGGLDAVKSDVRIPRRYGVDQTVGDTLGPGGVFRALRTAPVMRQIAEELDELAPGALLVQYANPMAINCWVEREQGARVIGLCHSVQHTHEKLSRLAGYDPVAVQFQGAGINHLFWFTELTHDGEDIYPEARAAVLERYPSPDLIDEHGSRKPNPRPWQPVDERALEDDLVRAEMLRTFGYFHTEGSHHASEYLPWFRKSAAITNAYLPRRNDYLENLTARTEGTRAQRADAIAREGLRCSEEYFAPMVAALQGGEPVLIHANVGNRMPDGGAVVEELPLDATVEVACRVDAAGGVQPLRFGALPPQCTAVTMLNVGVQRLAARGILEHDRDAITQAIALDPYTAATLTLPEIRHMVEAMFADQAQWLPDFSSLVPR
jgi:alpha-galactosidase